MLAKEKSEKDIGLTVQKIDFIDLFQKLHSEYKMDYDPKMARYF